MVLCPTLLALLRWSTRAMLFSSVCGRRVFVSVVRVRRGQSLHERIV